MFRHHQGLVKAFGLFILCFLSGILLLNAKSWVSLRAPASVLDPQAADFIRAMPAASVLESQDSKPAQGRSYFDKVFSEKGQYKIPYPFNQVLTRLADYTGQKLNASDGSGIKVALFPMGRSLQRSAAIEGLHHVTSLEPYFIFPRVVVGVDEEPTYENSLVLNLKNRLYLGFNEKAQVIEAISYNEEMGRYEYQVVQNYGPGKNPEVIYANRSLCLSCHQNLSPIFSRGPWSESNANPVVADQLQAALDRAYGKTECTSQKNQYCYQKENAFYFGAPIHIESNVTRQLDASTDLANLNHAYQKMWQDICSSLECKSAMLQAMILYRLTGQVGVTPSNEIKTWLEKMEQDWKVRFPWGLSIPSPDIPDRDPLKDFESSPHFSNLTTVKQENRQAIQALLKNSKIPAVFEPLQLRAPIDIWKGTGLEITTNTNRMVRGLAQDFTTSDLKLMDQWLQDSHQEKNLVTILTAQCQIDKDKSNFVISCTELSDKLEGMSNVKPNTKPGGEVGDLNAQLNTELRAEESFRFDAYLTMSASAQEGRAMITEFSLRSKVLGCDEHLVKTEKNILSGASCPKFSDVVGFYSKSAQGQSLLSLQTKIGLALRTYSGLDISEISFDQKTKLAQIKVYNQAAFVSEAISKNQKVLFSDRGFSRFQVMKTLVTQNQMKLARQQDELYTKLPLHLDASFTVEEIREQMNGFALMKSVCSQCHQSNSSTPPNFMGALSQPLNDYEQCRRIEQCAPRMLYRLKMRNCDLQTRKTKKNPMPPDSFFKDQSASMQWMNLHNPKIINFLSSLVDENQPSLDKNVLNEILKDGCPDLSSNAYEQLPKCEFNKLKTMTKCR